MNKFHNLTLALLTSAPLLACSQPPAPPAPPAAPARPVAGNEASPKTFIGRRVEEAISKARADLRTKNISISDGINININGFNIRHLDSGLPNAEITPQGDLLIDGKAVVATAAQRQQLLAYRAQIIGVTEAGMEIGAKSADIAGEAVSGLVGAIFGGDEGKKDLELRMDAQGKKLEAEAMKLCLQLPAILASQQALSASMPAVKPYVQMTHDDIDDCGKDVKQGTDRSQVQTQVREEIRHGIRTAIRGGTGDSTPATSVPSKS